MDALNLISLFVLMAALAALPSASVALVVARSVSHGFVGGVAVAVGIVLGDLALMLLALAGMATLADSLGPMFSLLRLAAAGYLVVLGIMFVVLPDSAAPPSAPGTPGRSAAAGCVAGLVLTLGDLKALVFYASVLPLVVDLDAASGADAWRLAVVTVVAVGGVKVAYAAGARRVADRHARRLPAARKALGVGLVGAGLWVAART